MSAPVSDSVVFPFSSSCHVGEFLLARKYPDWTNKELGLQEAELLIQSSRDTLFASTPIPMGSLIKLKAHLADPELFPLNEQEKETFSIPLIRLIGRLPDHEDAWGEVGLEGASIRKKASAMLNHISNLRRWVAPYPIDGLKSLLEQGMAGATDPKERNWFVLQLARLLLMERADASSVDQVLSFAVRDQQGRLVIARRDGKLLEQVGRMMTRRDG